MTADGLERIDEFARSHVAGDRVPGLVVLGARGSQVHVASFGSLTIGGPPVTRDPVFRIASTSKTITAAATLAVVEEGLVRLDEPVERLIPELARRPVLRRMDGPLDNTTPASRAIPRTISL